MKHVRSFIHQKFLTSLGSTALYSLVKLALITFTSMDDTAAMSRTVLDKDGDVSITRRNDFMMPETVVLNLSYKFNLCWRMIANLWRRSYDVAGCFRMVLRVRE